MDEEQWRTFLMRWSHAIIDSGEYENELPAEVLESGWLGFPGASDDQIQAAEQRLRVRLPPSYRVFLKVSNGWRRPSSFIDRLWSSEELTWYREHDPQMVELWTNLDEEPSADSSPPRGREMLGVLAISDYDDGIYLLNPAVQTPDGEWQAWFFASWVPGARVYRSFWELMQEEYADLLDLLRRRRRRRKPVLPVAENDVDGLIAVAKRGDSAVRRLALEAIARLGDTRALPAVLHIVYDQREDVMVREHASRTLALLGGVDAVPLLLDALRMRPPGIKARLVFPLLKMSLKLLKLPQTADISPQAMSRATTARPTLGIQQGLLEIGERALPALREALHDDDPGLRAEVISILSVLAMRKEAELPDELQACAADPEPEVRAALAASLFRTPTEKALDLLVHLLRDPDASVRLGAVTGCNAWLYQRREQRLITVLQHRLKHEDDLVVRFALEGILQRHLGAS